MNEEELASAVNGTGLLTGSEAGTCFEFDEIAVVGCGISMICTYSRGYK
jgi:hypothetical protein